MGLCLRFALLGEGELPELPPTSPLHSSLQRCPVFTTLNALKILSSVLGSGPQMQPLASAPMAPSTFWPPVPFSKPEVEGESGEGSQNDLCVSATMVPMQHPQPAAAEGMLLYEACLAPAMSCLMGTLLLPPSLQSAISPGRGLSHNCPALHLNGHKVCPMGECRASVMCHSGTRP